MSSIITWVDIDRPLAFDLAMLLTWRQNCCCWWYELHFALQDHHNADPGTQDSQTSPILHVQMVLVVRAVKNDAATNGKQSRNRNEAEVR